MMEMKPLAKRIFSELKIAESFTSLAALLGKTESEIVEYGCIGTHNGNFHCDEALACGMLKLLPKFAAFPILRTRNSELLEKCAVIVDVGAVYDETRQRFDHHQKEFTTKFDNLPTRATKLSSAGLVYKHFGKDIISQISSENKLPPLKADTLDKLYLKIYDDFIEHIDGIDNGVESFSGKDLTRNYFVSSSLSSRVGNLNPSWNDENLEHLKHKPEKEKYISELFAQAIYLTTNEFVDLVKYLLKSWLPARAIVEEAIQKRYQVDPSGEIILMERYAPWKDHLFEIEKDLKIEKAIKYLINQRDDGDWSVQCVPIDSGSFTSRKRLPENISGLRDEALSAATGIEGCIFVHASGFIGGNKTREGALKLAQLSLHA